jgi:CRP-like cAMP-binding protein
MTASDHLAPQALASLELFQDLPSAALDDVLTSARVWRLPRETRIFNQGDAGRAHALIEGSIRISQSGSDGAQIVMRFIAPGEMFGTVALFFKLGIEQTERSGFWWITIPIAQVLPCRARRISGASFKTPGDKIHERHCQ